MVDEIQVPPFFEWLLGPGWHDGVLFQSAVLTLVVLIMLLATAVLIYALRKESRIAATIAGSMPILAPVVAAAAFFGVWKIAKPDLAPDEFGVWLLGQGWTAGALYRWLAVVFGLVLAGMFIGGLLAVLHHGPIRGLRVAGRTLAEGTVQLAAISPRRVWALAWLAVKESVRRRVVVGFAVFILILLFAGWFLDPGSTNPARLYLSFVLTATSYLVLILVLFLSAFSLPADLRSKTLHTVVTKPVRRSEIVLGRIAGFAIVGTGLLAVMCLISYFFVVRGLNHTHTVTAEDLKSFGQAATGGQRARQGQTSQNKRHRHKAMISASGRGRVESERGHWHSITMDDSGSKPAYTLGPPEGNLLARVPVYGDLWFRDRDGVDTPEGINVGDEWTYRSYIQGGSQAAAIWTFRDLDENQFPERLPVEMNIGVFRTHKGNIEKGVLGSLSLRNPDTGLAVEVEIFESKEFTSNQLSIPRKIIKFSGAQIIPRKVKTSEGMKSVPSPVAIEKNKGLAEKTEFDLFKDLVSDGRLEIWLRCVETKQYFGAAKPDLYLRAADSSFTLNFIKGYFGIWMQMLLVIGFGVMFSTFLSGAVAMIATVGVLVGGFVSAFMRQLALGETYGGGPVESLIRLVRQDNVMSKLDPGLGGEVAQMVDRVLEYGLWVMSAVMPSFGNFSYATHVAYGFNVSTDLILIRAVGMLGFLVPVLLAGYFFLKTREVAR